MHEQRVVGRWLRAGHRLLRGVAVELDVGTVALAVSILVCRAFSGVTMRGFRR
jgi:hypothetical protein